MPPFNNLFLKQQQTTYRAALSCVDATDVAVKGNKENLFFLHNDAVLRHAVHSGWLYFTDPLHACQTISLEI
jgi:hypothetical protein